MRLILFLLLLPPLFLVISCTSTAKKEDLLVKEEELWLQAYLRAKTNAKTDSTLKPENPELSCELFTKLSQENKFVLKNLALIRARMVCENTANLAPAPVDINKELGPSMLFLKNINDQRALVEAERSQDPAALAAAWRAKALASDRIREKVQFLEKALSYAAGSTVSSAKLAPAQPVSAEEIQNRIYALAPRLRPNPSPNDFQKIGNDYAFNREFQTAREFYQKIINSKSISFEDQYQARKSLRNSYKVEQNREQHIIESEKLTRWLLRANAPGAMIHESYITWARSLWTIGNASEAKVVLQKAEKSLKMFYPLDEVEFIRGRMSEEISDFKSALMHFEKGEKIAKPKSLSHDRLVFSKAWALRKLGRFAEAATTLGFLKEQTQDPFDAFRYQFWQGRSLKQAGLADKAKEIFQALRTEDSLGYYGLLAHRELAEILPPLNLSPTSNLESDLESDSRSPASSTPLTKSTLDPETTRMIRALSVVDESEVLEKYLNQKTQDLKSSGSQDPKIWLTYLKAYAQAGLFLPLFTQLGALDNNLKSQLLKDHPDLLFPKKYSELINPWSEKLQVNPELVLSIIRQESAFNPQARSPADAFGLMQVLPIVASEQEKITGVKLTHHEDLYIPENNIPVGVALLSQLGRKYRGQFILTAAAYNASERAIEGWLKTRLKDDPLEFIEDIPYDETRAYVKLVIRNFIFYTRLKQPQIAMTFPEWCLEDLQSFNLSTR